MQSAAIEWTEAEFASQIEPGFGTYPLLISRGYQGAIHLIELRGERFIVKTPHGRGLTGRIRLAMLRNEYRVYQKLAEVDGIPKCYGLVGGRHLVLEYIESDNLRHTTIRERDPFFDRLLSTIQNLHRHDVAHGDLKKRDNVIVDRAHQPFVIDFGVAVVRRAGFHPLNRFLFQLARSMDLNAWIKHKYGSYQAEMTEADRPLLRRTLIERVSRRLRGGFKWLRNSPTRRR